MPDGTFPKFAEFISQRKCLEREGPFKKKTWIVIGQLKQVATALGFLLVRWATLDVRHCPTPQSLTYILPKSVRSK